MSKELIKASLKAVGEVIIGFFLGAVACFLITLCSCTTTKYVEVEVPKVVTQTNIERRTDIVRDTLIQRDSVIIIQKGDTIYHETWHKLQSINNWYVTDTVRDTIPQIEKVTVKIPVEVEKKLSKWQSFKIEAGGFLLSAVGLALLALIIWAIIKVRKVVKR